MQRYGGNQAESTNSDADTHHTHRHNHLTPQSTQVFLLGVAQPNGECPFTHTENDPVPSGTHPQPSLIWGSLAAREVFS